MSVVEETHKWMPVGNAATTGGTTGFYLGCRVEKKKIFLSDEYLNSQQVNNCPFCGTRLGEER